MARKYQEKESSGNIEGRAGGISGDIGGRAGGISGDIEGRAGGISGRPGVADRLSDRIDRIEGRIDRLDGRIDRIEDRIITVALRLEEVLAILSKANLLEANQRRISSPGKGGNQ